MTESQTKDQPPRYNLYKPTVEAAKMNIIVYGEPGAGKTTFAATAQDHPLMKDVLFLNVEGGMLAVARRGDIQTIDVRSVAELESRFWDIRQALSEKTGPLAGVKTVVLDSGSEMQTVNLEEIKKKENDKKPRDDPDETFLADYGKSSAQMAKVSRWFRDLNIHFIMTALPKEIYPPTPKGQVQTSPPIDIMPSFTVKLAKAIMGYMDFVWYLYADKQGERHLMTKPVGAYRAKTRGQQFADAISPRVSGDKINLAQLYDLMLEKEKSSA